jgi:transposase-like protein
MPRSRVAYPLEFRQKLIELVGTGRSPEQLAKEFEPSAQTIRNWVKRAQADAGKRHDVRSGPINLDSRISVISARRGDGIARWNGARDGQEAETKSWGGI